MKPTTGLLLVATLLAAPFVPLDAGSATMHDPIQPGDPLTDGDGDAYCTLSYVFDSETSADVYLSTAGHCVDEGDVVHTTSHPSFGTVVLLGDGGTSGDYALIEVHAEDRDAVEADVRGHPGTPTGVAQPGDTMPGDLVTMSGWGTATSETATTRENRTGVLTDHTESVMQAQTTAHPGDSGGPWTHASGLALGIVSRISVSFGFHDETVTAPIVEESVDVPVPSAFAGDEGPTVQGLLAGAQQQGYELSLRTAG